MKKENIKDNRNNFEEELFTGNDNINEQLWWKFLDYLIL